MPDVSRFDIDTYRDIRPFRNNRLKRRRDVDRPQPTFLLSEPSILWTGNFINLLSVIVRRGRFSRAAARSCSVWLD